MLGGEGVEVGGNLINIEEDRMQRNKINLIILLGIKVYSFFMKGRDFLPYSNNRFPFSIKKAWNKYFFLFINE